MIKEVPGTLSVDLDKPTPKWAKMVYRLVFGVTTVISVWIMATGLISPTVKAEVIIGLKLFDGLIYTIAQMLGVEIVATPIGTPISPEAINAITDKQT